MTSAAAEQLRRTRLPERMSNQYYVGWTVTVFPRDRVTGIGGPSLKSRDDRAQRRERRAAGLPSVGGDDAADRAAVEIGPRIAAQALERVERILDQAGDRAVVAGR